MSTSPGVPTGADLEDLEALYKDLHRHPELSMQEQRTADIAAERLRAAGFEVTTGVGGTGVVGLLHNGDGPTVMLRADMDALPVPEQTGLDYASTVDGVMHACGHDMHVTWLVGVADALAANRASWRGTVMAVFQPGEETAEGARAMLDDGIFERFPRPDVVLGQHVMPTPAGTFGSRPGVITSAGDTIEVTMFGRGAHGSMPQASIDPVVMAAATVLRLQGIVGREVSPADPAVVTVGSVQAGSKANVIPDEAVLKINVRTYDDEVRSTVLGAIERIVRAEAAASGAPREPEIAYQDRYDLNDNDPEATARVMEALRSRFGDAAVDEIAPLSASEDFGSFGREGPVPSVFWTVGGTDPDTYRQAQAEGRVAELPTNHNPRFAPIVHPTLELGLEAMLAAAMAWLAVPSTVGADR